MKYKTAQAIMVGLLFSGGLINYMDRSVFAILAPQISNDLQLTPAQLGWAFGFFSLGYTLFCFIGGWASDKYGPKRTLLVSMAIWSLFCAATGWASGVVSLIVIRFLFGVGESPWIAAANKILTQWVSKDKYSTAFGLASCGQPLGGVLAGPLIGALSIVFPWRDMFAAVALLGVFWLVVWYFYAADSASQHPKISEQVPSLDDALEEEQATTLTARMAIFSPIVISVAAAFFSYVYMLYFFLSWFPSYLTESFGLSLRDMSMASAVPWLLGTFGLVVGGVVCDTVSRVLGDPINGNKLVLCTGLVVAAISVFLAGHSGSAVGSVVLMSLGVGSLYLTGPAYFSIALNGIGRAHMGKVAGFIVLIANLGGMLSPIVTGYVVQLSGQFSMAFSVASGLVVVGAAVVALFAAPQRQWRFSYNDKKKEI